MKLVFLALFTLAISISSTAFAQQPLATLNSSEYYMTDNCSGAIIGISDATHSCELLKTPPAMAWSIKINGVCLNIADQPADKACENFGFRDFKNAIYFYSTDNCTQTITTVIDPATTCESLDAGRNVWSIFKNNRCMNIVDVSEVVACQRFK